MPKKKKKKSPAYTGRDLIHAGYKPGPWFKRALNGLNSGKISWAEIPLYAPQPKDSIDLQEPCDQKYFLSARTQEEITNLKSVQATSQELAKVPTLRCLAIMPDACPAGPLGTIPVGGVAKAENAIHPGMHSADICCSMFRTELRTEQAKPVLDAMHSATHFGPGGRPEHSKLPKGLKQRILDNPFTHHHLQRAQTDLGTQGDGNHFAFVGHSDQSGLVSLVTHHGSRGFGAMVYKSGMRVAEKYRQEICPQVRKGNAWIPMDTEDGKLYWEALAIVRDWTQLNHQVLHDATLFRTGLEIENRHWNEHNFVFERDGFYYHGKGATPMWDYASQDELVSPQRIVPLNMAAPILIMEGGKSEAMDFAPHGAGRNMSRTQHIKSGRANLARETAKIDARFYSGMPDLSELPSAYKDAATIESEIGQFGLGIVVERILPYGSIMAGRSKFQRKRKKK
ncbi:MAG: RtcB family protein [Bacteroidota bacterium]